MRPFCFSIDLNPRVYARGELKLSFPKNLYQRCNQGLVIFADILVEFDVDEQCAMCDSSLCVFSAA